MWEEIETGSKWVLVSQCYFPGDLPAAVGHPCASESNEVNCFLMLFCILFIFETLLVLKIDNLHISLGWTC